MKLLVMVKTLTPQKKSLLDQFLEVVLKKAQILDGQLVYHDALSSDSPVQDCDVVVGFSEDLSGMEYAASVPICVIPVSLVALDRRPENKHTRNTVGRMIVSFFEAVRGGATIMCPLALFTLSMPFLHQEGLKRLAMTARNGYVTVVLEDGKTLRIGQTPGVSDYFLTWEEVLGVAKLMEMFHSSSISLEQTHSQK